ncbi:cyclin-domain-containing protein [Amylocarpus encephaloides]|uniref:Cyclin-domain-containing protein n=1 Tax=Amylocarpus encephaloides TaxID=45428 RepID=A0A9P8C835_9HELO|nr:cyclin-domain-containing protein [Amylocarpus encephaloides]
MNLKVEPATEGQLDTNRPPKVEEVIAPSAPIVTALDPSNPMLMVQSPATKRRQSAAGPSWSVAESPQVQTKRVRQAQANVKTLPRKYERCEVEDMVILVADMISELIQTNDGLPLRSGVLTRFHSRTPPGISVLDYLQRLAKHATLSPPLLLSMVYYIDRLCSLYPAFTVTTLTIHRFLITAATVAAKGLSDSFWNNATYARVGGIKLAELGLLELEFLYRVDWKIVPNPEVLVDYYRGLIDRSDAYELEDDSSSEGEGEEEGGEGHSSDSTDADIKREEQTDVQWKAWMTENSTQKAENKAPELQHKLSAQDLIALTNTMKLSHFILVLFAGTSLASGIDPFESIEVSFQPISPTSTAIQTLAELHHSTLFKGDTTAGVTSFDYPDLSPDIKLLRIGIYSSSLKKWTSSVSTTSAETFAKGYSVTFVLSLDVDGEVVGVTAKSAKIDAGATRDFAPKVKVVWGTKGRKPALNRPVVLSAEGKLEEPELEKTFLQRYWWVLLGAVMIMMTAGGG